MTTPKIFLRGSDVQQDISENRPFLWSDGYHVLAIALVGGAATACLLAPGIINGIEAACFNEYTSYFVDRSVCMLFDNESTVRYFSGALATLGALGTFAGSIFKDSSTWTKEKAANDFIGDQNKIISKSMYEKLLKMMKPNISTDLEEKYNVPGDNEIGTILEREKKALNNMLEQILKPNADLVSIYSEALNQLTAALPINKFLENNLNVENISGIFNFAKQNNLHALKIACKEYYSENAIEISFSRKHVKAA